jgi:hypothetical protein
MIEEGLTEEYVQYVEEDELYRCWIYLSADIEEQTGVHYLDTID